MMKTKTIIFALSVLLLTSLNDAAFGQGKNSLHIISKKEIGQVEVGNPYVGIEIHNSFPMLNRISFYYPVANSLDISEDYWKRANYRIMNVGLKIGDSPKEFLKNEVYEVDQTPYSVSFSKSEKDAGIKIGYEFCKDEPAMLITYNFTNNSASVKSFEVYTRLTTVLRTSHTYQAFDSASSTYNSKNNTLSLDYNYIETGKAKVFISSAGLKPESCRAGSSD